MEQNDVSLTSDPWIGIAFSHFSVFIPREIVSILTPSPFQAPPILWGSGDVSHSYKIYPGFSYIPLIQHFFLIDLIFGCAGSLLLRWTSSSCGEWRILSSCSAQASPAAASLVAEHQL